MSTDAHETEEYAKINLSKAIPTLVVEQTGKEPFVLTQSIAILEYFEEQFPNRKPLLPPLDQPEKRAIVRAVQNIITNDIFPPVNSRIAMRVRAIRGEREDQVKFVHRVNSEGFAAYEAMLERYGGLYTVGDEVSLADVCLVPAVDQAKLHKLDLSTFPRMTAVYDRLMELDAFKKGSFRAQEDTPEAFRSAK